MPEFMHIFSRLDARIYAYFQVLLKEMKESLLLCTSMLDRLDKSTSNKLGHVKQMLESLTTDRSDDRVIREGIERMRQHVVDRRRIVRVADELPLVIRVAICRIVNKFGKRSETRRHMDSYII